VQSICVLGTCTHTQCSGIVLGGSDAVDNLCKSRPCRHRATWCCARCSLHSLQITSLQTRGSTVLYVQGQTVRQSTLTAESFVSPQLWLCTCVSVLQHLSSVAAAGLAAFALQVHCNNTKEQPQVTCLVAKRLNSAEVLVIQRHPASRHIASRHFASRHIASRHAASRHVVSA